MSCNISKFDFCILQQETFTSPTFEFENTDVSNDTFVYAVFKSFGSEKKVFPINFIDDNTVYIEDIKMPFGNYQHELIWIRNGIKEVVFQGSLKVTNKGSNCGCTSNKNTIKVVNEDVVVKVNYSERVIERITDKGPAGDSAYQVAVENGFVGTEAEWLESLHGEKGDAFTYDDFTPEQLEDLKGDKGDNGWSPKFVFEEDGAQRLVKKLTDYIGGTGDKPTDNIGEYVTDGGYTADKSLATNFKGEQNDNLIVEYVHSGNIEAYIDSIDYETNTFTSVGHGFTNNQRVCFGVDLDVTFPSSVLPIPSDLSANGFRTYFIINSTADTFQLSTASGGSVFELFEKPTVDLSKFKIEQLIALINLTNLPPNLTNCKVVILGKSNRGNNNVSVYSSGITPLAWITNTGTGNFLATGGTVFFNGTYELSIIDGICYGKQNSYSVTSSTDTANTAQSIVQSYIKNAGTTEYITSITIETSAIPNGFIIRIYKK